MSIFNFRFRTRRVLKGHRAFQPELSMIEPRILLDAGVITSLAQSPIVGGHFELQAMQTGNVPYAPGTVASTTWTITGAYSGYTLDAKTGYHPTTLQTITVAGDTISGYWNEQAGVHAVTVTVNFVQPTWQGVPIPTYWPTQISSAINIATPTVTTQTRFGDTNLVNTSYSSTLYAGNLTTLTPGFHSNISVTTPDNVGGTFGVVQMLDPTLKYYKNINGVAQEFDGFTNPDGTPSGRIVDKLSSSDLPYYNGTVNVGQTLMVDDTPQTSMNDPRTYRMTVFDQFTDTVMYTPPGGMPVPISTMSWAYGATVVRDSTGTPIISPFAAKTDPNFVPGPTGQIGWSSGSGTTFPQWNGKVTDYLNNGSPILVNMPLSGVIPLPDPGLASYWYSIGDPYYGYYVFDDPGSDLFG